MKSRTGTKSTPEREKQPYGPSRASISMPSCTFAASECSTNLEIQSFPNPFTDHGSCHAMNHDQPVTALNVNLCKAKRRLISPQGRHHHVTLRRYPHLDHASIVGPLVLYVPTVIVQLRVHPRRLHSVFHPLAALVDTGE